MGGKLVGFLVMALVAMFAWKWLRAQQAGGGGQRRPPMPRDEARHRGGREDEDVITLERDPETGVYRPGGERKNENDRS